MATEPARPRVTGLVPDPRHEGSVRLQVDGRTLLTVPADILARLDVEVGEPLPTGEHETLCQAADVEAAYRTALRALGRRPFAGRDLARRLVLKGHPPQAADEAVARAERAGLVNDEQFARHFIQTRIERGRGPARLRRELAGMGVSGGVVDRLLTEEMPAERRTAQVEALARKRAGQLAHLPRPDRLRRLVGFLARKGHRGAEVHQIAKRAVSE